MIIHAKKKKKTLVLKESIKISSFRQIFYFYNEQTKQIWEHNHYNTEKGVSFFFFNKLQQQILRRTKSQILFDLMPKIGNVSRLD